MTPGAASQLSPFRRFLRGWRGDMGQNQLAFLRVLQCNEAQGYLFSPPVPAEVAGKLLATQRFALRLAA